MDGVRPGVPAGSLELTIPAPVAFVLRRVAVIGTVVLGQTSRVADLEVGPGQHLPRRVDNGVLWNDWYVAQHMNHPEQRLAG